MLNNRMHMIKQQTEIENLQNENENLINDLRELSLKNLSLKEEIEQKDLKIAELYKKLSKAECKLNRYMNHVKMNLDREL